MAYEKEQEVAIAAVLQAAELCRQVRFALVTDETISKRDKSPVTVADFGAQALVSRALGAAFPHDPIVGEESADELRQQEALLSRVLSAVNVVEPEATAEDVLAAIGRCTHSGGPTGRFWTLDPIDGTKGFLRNEQYAVALALIENGQVQLGLLACPNLSQSLEGKGPGGTLFVAVRGEGAHVSAFDGSWGEPVKVSGTEDPAAAAFCESVEAGHSSHDDAARIAERLGVTRPPLRLDSQAKYSVVARGEADIYLRLPTIAGYEEKIWDHAAGALLIEEAGGKVTDTRGLPLDFSRGRTLAANVGVVATNGPLHDRVVEAVKAVLQV